MALKKDEKPETGISKVETPVNAPAIVSTGKLNASETLSVQEIGQRYRRLGWDASDASVSAEAIGKALPGKFTGRLISDLARSLRAVCLGAAMTDPSARQKYAATSETVMGTQFVQVTETFLGGQVIALPKKARKTFE